MVLKACVKVEEKIETEVAGTEWGNVSSVLFDMDGVLCNSEEPSRMAGVDIFVEMGVEVTVEDFVPLIGTAVTTMFSEEIPNDVSPSLIRKEIGNISLDDSGGSGGYTIADEKMQGLQVLHTSAQSSAAMLEERTENGSILNQVATNDNLPSNLYDETRRLNHSIHKSDAQTKSMFDVCGIKLDKPTILATQDTCLFVFQYNYVRIARKMGSKTPIQSALFATSFILLVARFLTLKQSQLKDLRPSPDVSLHSQTSFTQLFIKKSKKNRCKNPYPVTGEGAKGTSRGIWPIVTLKHVAPHEEEEEEEEDDLDTFLMFFVFVFPQVNHQFLSLSTRHSPPIFLTTPFSPFLTQLNIVETATRELTAHIPSPSLPSSMRLIIN
ncbi:unnamed protein product [Dovyalis caffra]|uniref:Uncharacterized protein n=1 Tax=Dovyalis caffra TaxID=77055 RepID=A0AAV1RVY7_9ROSI|nr:unnamed protein product [Dovyalis caffra]